MTVGITLGIDTTADFCAVGLWAGDARDGRAVATRCEAMVKGHAEALFPMLEHLLGEAGVPRTGLDRVAVVRGPGTFTGTRIGLAAARGLALALAIPAIGVTTFEFLAGADAARHDRSVPLAVALDARRGEIYLQIIGVDGAPLGEPAVTALRDAGDLLPSGPVAALGSGADMLAAAIRDRGGPITVRAAPRRDGAQLARLAADLDPADHPPLPLYMRPPDATPLAPTGLRRANGGAGAGRPAG